MKKRYLGILFCGILIIEALLAGANAPITFGHWTKQTAYLWLLNSFHRQVESAKAKILLIDDDCGDGIYTLKHICDKIGIKAVFAVIPARLDEDTCDSLIQWQTQGYGICLHGYNHNDWKEWSCQEIIEDIEKGERILSEYGFDTARIARLIVPPYSRNTRAIREAISEKRYQMVTGAGLVNPDTTLFQLGRIFITADTKLEEMEQLLRLAKESNSFVILGTHASEMSEFSPEKTLSVLTLAKAIGFE